MDKRIFLCKRGSVELNELVFIVEKSLLGIIPPLDFAPDRPDQKPDSRLSFSCTILLNAQHVKRQKEITGNQLHLLLDERGTNDQ